MKRTTAGCAHCGHAAAHASWKGRQGHWAQRRAGVLGRTGSVHTGQAPAPAPAAGAYNVWLTARAGSTVFDNTPSSKCRQSNTIGESTTDSMFICASDPRSTPTNPDSRRALGGGCPATGCWL